MMPYLGGKLRRIGLQQQLHDGEIALQRSHMQRSRADLRVDGGYRRFCSQQALDDGLVLVLHSDVQWGVSVSCLQAKGEG